MGAQVSNGQLMSTPSELKGMYAFGVTNDGTPILDEFAFSGSITAEMGLIPTRGMNKTSYALRAPDQRIAMRIQLISTHSAWKAIERPKNSSTTPTEVMVTDGVITDISVMAGLPTAIPEGSYILRTHGSRQSS